MKQAILTKYLGPTNTKGARVKAWCYGKPRGVTVVWNHEHDSEWNHMRAAIHLGQSLGWTGTGNRQGGALPDGTGYCFVQIEKEES
jgi:hypothetical protein